MGAGEGRAASRAVQRTSKPHSEWALKPWRTSKPEWGLHELWGGPQLLDPSGPSPPHPHLTPPEVRRPAPDPTCAPVPSSHPRMCVGYRYALLEGALALGSLYSRFTFALQPGQVGLERRSC